MSEQINIEVDLDVCIGSAMCRATAGTAFVEGPEGKSVPGDPGGDPREAILEAAELCPSGAITVRDADTGEILAP